LGKKKSQPSILEKHFLSLSLTFILSFFSLYPSVVKQTHTMTNQCNSLTRGPSNKISSFRDVTPDSLFFPTRTKPGGMRYKSVPDNIGSAARFTRQGCLSLSWKSISMAIPQRRKYFSSELFFSSVFWNFSLQLLQLYVANGLSLNSSRESRRYNLRNFFTDLISYLQV